MKNEITPYRNFRQELQALEILKILLLKECGGTALDRVIGRCLDEIYLGGSREEIRAALRRLEQSDLVRTKEADEYLVVMLTERGERVGKGREQADGVDRPSVL